MMTMLRKSRNQWEVPSREPKANGPNQTHFLLHTSVDADDEHSLAIGDYTAYLLRCLPNDACH